MTNDKINENTEPVTEEAAEEIVAEVVDEPNEKDEKKDKKEEKKSKKAEKEIEELKTKLAENDDRFLRLAAEYDNYRKRTIKEKSDAYADAYCDAVKSILPLADSLDKALEFTPDDEGIKALSKLFTDILAKMGVSAIESDGVEFDPNLHNAIMHDDDDSLGENMVSQTFQKGYKLGEKVIRHAMVKVVN